MKKGNIGITTENIFPVIKKFLYSDHEIFLREIVSNAVDATQKLKTLSSKGEFNEELGDLTIQVHIDQEAGTLTISDKGIGMTADEIEKYINQIAFSGATEFLEKYKDNTNAIIGHFGLGFYSTFMVSQRVDIITRSYQENAQAVKWTCDGSPEFEISEIEKSERGTDIVLHISDDCKEFLEKSKIQELLSKYCKFLPIAVAFGKKTKWEEGKEVETDEFNIINETQPLWTKAPSTLNDDEYKKFYADLYPMNDDPLFWIHLNVDYPFNLTGLLYFPKIKNNIEIHRNKIQLYCNQVFVTDHVENIVPDFLTLLHGVIDSPDIPLNVSRSYLQSDANVKKISTYITKKVCDRLHQIFKNNLDEFKEKWNDLKLFIHYGMLSQPDFYEKAHQFSLLSDVDGKFYTYEEYKEAVKENQTDKTGKLICLYTNDKEAQFSYIETAKKKGYNVLLMDGQLDSHLVGLLEQKWENTHFVRVDADIIDNLIEKDNNNDDQIAESDKNILSQVFMAVMPKNEKCNFNVSLSAMCKDDAPIVLTQSEYMRRMKEMSQIQSGMSFYGEMPDMYNLVLNTNHPLIETVLHDTRSSVDDQLQPIENELRGLNARRMAIEQAQKDIKPEDLTQAEKDDLKACQDAITTEENKKTDILNNYAKNNVIIPQLIDLALLQNGLLKGESLNKFIKRSIELVK